MKRSTVLLLSLLVLVSCTSHIRYTVEEIKDYPPNIQKKIKIGEVTTGMTYLQVRYAWGAPHVIDVLPPSEEGHETITWTYKKFQFFKTILTFVDGKLIEIVSTEPGVIK
ncbi:MAG: hypothetical protein V3V59_02725 [Thermodesulfovibrionales bacterium]